MVNSPTPLPSERVPYAVEMPTAVVSGATKIRRSRDLQTQLQWLEKRIVRVRRLQNKGLWVQWIGAFAVTFLLTAFFLVWLGVYGVRRLWKRRSPPAQRTTLLTPFTEVFPLIAWESGEFLFYLNPERLAYLRQAQKQDQPLAIPPKLLADLRNYALLSPLKSATSRRPDKVLAQSGLTFCTCYSSERQITRSPQSKTLDVPPRLVRTVISLDGDVLQQIHQDALTHAQGKVIIATHHWLCQQLLGQLRTSTTYFLDVGVWMVSVILWFTSLVTGLGSSGSSQTPAWAVFILSTLMPLVWESVRDWLLPRITQLLVRVTWKQLTTPNSWLYGWARWMLRLG